MSPQQLPEMTRMPLENLVLNVKAMKGDEVSVTSYLRSAISPPEVNSIDQAVRLLTDMNVLFENERLSALGKHLTLLPLDVRLAKLLILGCTFHCLDSALTAAAILSSKPLFNAPFEQRDEAKRKRLEYVTGNSDILTDVNVYQQWRQARQDGAKTSELRRWCEDRFVSASTLRDVSQARDDLLRDLIEAGIVPLEYRNDARQGGKVNVLDENASDINLQRALLLAAMYPSIVRIAPPSTKYDKAIAGTVEREVEAKQVRYFDAQGQRVFLHPGSVLFDVNKYQSGFLTCFRKGATQSRQQHAGNAQQQSDKIVMRDATEVPMYSLLLFGGKLSVHHQMGGISIHLSGQETGASSEGWIKLRAGGRIAALINQLRYLLDAALAKSFDDPSEDVFAHGIEAKVRDCLYNILRRDGQ